MSTSQPKVKILLIDDEPLVLSSLQRLLRGENFSLILCPSAEEGLKKLKTEEIATIVCDERLPGMRGTQFLALAKKVLPEVSGILLTGFYEENVLKAAIKEAEVYGFVTKPWNDEKLRLMLKNAVRRTQVLRESQQLLGQISRENEKLQHLTQSIQKKLRQSSLHWKSFTEQLREEKHKLQQLSELLRNIAQAENPKILKKKMAAIAKKRVSPSEMKQISALMTLATERAQIIDITRRASSQWQETFNAIGDPVTIITPHFDLLRANQTTERFTHQPARDVTGKKCYEVLVGTTKPCAHCPAVLAMENGQPHISSPIDEFQNRDVRCSSFPISDKRGKIRALVQYYKDISTEKALYGKLIQSEKMAAIGSFTSTLAHELLSPIQKIHRFSKELKSQAPQTSPLYADILEIEKGAHRCLDIIDSLFTLSAQPIKAKEKTDIHKLLERTIDSLQMKLDQKKIKLIRHYTERAPLLLLRAGEMEQVLTNIINNAIDAVPTGGTIIAKTIFKPQAHYAYIDISDTGSGISREELDKIFDPFYTTKGKRKGTGLGLPLSFKIVEEHGGTIRVKSEVGKGTLFEVSLPL